MTSKRAASKANGWEEDTFPVESPNRTDHAGDAPVVKEARSASKVSKPQKKQQDHHGHRDRLRERFKNVGAAGLQDYELLELLLFAIVPRKDTKPIAKAMIKRFGTFSEAIGAPSHLLEEIDGLGANTILSLKAVLAAAQRIGKDAVHNRPFLPPGPRLSTIARPRCRTKPSSSSASSFSTRRTS